MELSEEVVGKFKQSSQWAALQGSYRVDARVLVLTTGFWPSYAPSADVGLPRVLQQHVSAFTAFYAAQYAGRRLQWQHALSHCVLRAYFAGSRNRRELHVSLYQAVALMAFDDDDTHSSAASGGRALELTLSQLQTRTQMERSELGKALRSLSRKQLPLLLCSGADEAGTETLESGSFSVNSNFTCKSFRVHVNAAQAKESSEERSKTNEGVTRERLHALDAAIVRILKARKSLSHSELIAEVIRALQGRFTPQPSDIKGRLESLIEREYMKRDEANLSLYHYLA